MTLLLFAGPSRAEKPAAAGPPIGGGNYGIGPRGVAATNDLVWRNDTSGRLVVWHLDNAGNRTSGGFTTPDSPSDAINWRGAGPR